MRRPTGLDGLKRFHGRVPKHWPLPNEVSSSWGLYVYYTLLKKCGQINIAYDLTHFLRWVVSKWKKYTREKPQYAHFDYYDDFVRNMLKALSAYCYNKTFECGPAYMLLSHVHALTGKAPYEESKILDEITNWVSGTLEGAPKKFDAEQTKLTLDRIFSTWYRGEPESFLTFNDYCNDFMRWGTSGGAPKTEYLGSKYRTKWAFALSKATNADGSLKETYDIYTEAKKIDNLAHVALKEEAQKTREIITTPMPSYLRQCYLLYRWGKPRIPSPISSAKWLPHFETTSVSYYGCIDGERFDWSMPKEFIIDVINRLGTLDDQTRLVAEEEIAAINSLELEWRNHTWKYEGGLLSGWRMTSLLGSLISCCAVDYIINKCNKAGCMKYGVMGDDVVIYSHVDSIDKETLVDLYTEYGLSANLKKTVTGNVGEFLRKVRSPGGSWGYPALALRTLIYANPWVQSYTYEREEEVSSGWMSVLSRLLPHSTSSKPLIDAVLNLSITNLTQLFGNKDWMPWLLTPISAGGGGCIELSNGENWSYLDRSISYSTLPRHLVIPALLGAAKVKSVVKRLPSLMPVNMNAVYDTVAKLESQSLSAPTTRFKKGASITKTIFGIMFQEYSNSTINQAITTPIPSSLRTATNRRKIAYLLSDIKEYSGITSITHSKEALPATSSISHFLSRSIASKMKRMNYNIIKPAITIYQTMIYSRVQLPYGTW